MGMGIPINQSRMPRMLIPSEIKTCINAASANGFRPAVYDVSSRSRQTQNWRAARNLRLCSWVLENMSPRSANISRRPTFRSRIWPLVGYASLALLTLARHPPFSQAAPRNARQARQFQEPAASTGRIAQVAGCPPVLTHPAAWWSLLRETVSGWLAHKAAKSGAALAYYSIFSLGPLLVVAIAVAGLVFGQDAVRGEVSRQLTGLIGEQGSKGIESMLAGAVGRPGQGIFATILGVGTLLFAAVGVVVQLKDALNTVWEVKLPPKSGVWGFVRTYAVSLAGVLSLGFLLLVSLVVTSALSAMGNTLAPYLPEAVFHIVSFGISFAAISLLFAMMFKWLPDADIG